MAGVTNIGLTRGVEIEVAEPDPIWFGTSDEITHGLGRPRVISVCTVREDDDVDVRLDTSDFLLFRAIPHGEVGGLDDGSMQSSATALVILCQSERRKLIQRVIRETISINPDLTNIWREGNTTDPESGDVIIPASLESRDIVLVHAVDEELSNSRHGSWPVKNELDNTKASTSHGFVLREIVTSDDRGNDLMSVQTDDRRPGWVTEKACDICDILWVAHRAYM
jgi:hypothetical protein